MSGQIDHATDHAFATLVKVTMCCTSRMATWRLPARATTRRRRRCRSIYTGCRLGKWLQQDGQRLFWPDPRLPGADGAASGGASACAQCSGAGQAAVAQDHARQTAIMADAEAAERASEEAMRAARSHGR